VSTVSELNKQKIRLFVEAVINEGRLELIGDLVAADYVGHFPCVDVPVTGPGRVQQLVSSQRRANPGLHIEIKDQIAEEDRVVFRWQARALQAAGRPAAPNPSTLCCTGISIVRLLAGKQVDSHTECTNLSLPGPESES
jgi:SnoaL-like polyketide cyclase